MFKVKNNQVLTRRAKMKRLLIMALALFAVPVFGFYPMSNNDGLEIRVVSKLQAPDWSMGHLEGQLLTMKVHDKVTVGGIWEMHEDNKNSFAVQTTYQVNPYLDVAVAGKVFNLKSFGGEVLLNGKLNYKNHVIKPFFKMDHKKLTEVGLAYFFALKKTSFHVGAAVQPKKDFKGLAEVTVFAGTSFANKGPLMKELESGVK